VIFGDAHASRERRTLEDPLCSVRGQKQKSVGMLSELVELYQQQKKHKAHFLKAACTKMLSVKIETNSFVDVKDELSSPQIRESGVPQGSILGPLLFLMISYQVMYVADDVAY